MNTFMNIPDTLFAESASVELEIINKLGGLKYE